MCEEGPVASPNAILRNQSLGQKMGSIDGRAGRGKKEDAPSFVLKEVQCSTDELMKAVRSMEHSEESGDWQPRSMDYMNEFLVLGDVVRVPLLNQGKPMGKYTKCEVLGVGKTMSVRVLEAPKRYLHWIGKIFDGVPREMCIKFKTQMRSSAGTTIKRRVSPSNTAVKGKSPSHSSNSQVLPPPMQRSVSDDSKHVIPPGSLKPKLVRRSSLRSGAKRSSIARCRTDRSHEKSEKGRSFQFPNDTAEEKELQIPEIKRSASLPLPCHGPAPSPSRSAYSLTEGESDEEEKKNSRLPRYDCSYDKTGDPVDDEAFCAILRRRTVEILEGNPFKWHRKDLYLKVGKSLKAKRLRRHHKKLIRKELASSQKEKIEDQQMVDLRTPEMWECGSCGQWCTPTNKFCGNCGSKRKEGAVTDETTPNECSLCMDGPQEFACIPCGHRCMCHKCVSTYERRGGCPICFQSVKSIIRIYDT